MQLGRYGKNAGSNNLENFGRVAKIWVDPKTNEAYIADGYTNKRVAVVDADTGKMKTLLGRVRQKRTTLPGQLRSESAAGQQFRNPVHCVERSNDGLVYVCDRQGDRVQVFRPDGTFVKEGFYARRRSLRARPGNRVLEGSRAALHVPRRRPEREGAHHMRETWRRF